MRGIPQNITFPSNYDLPTLPSLSHHH